MFSQLNELTMIILFNPSLFWANIWKVFANGQWLIIWAIPSFTGNLQVASRFLLHATVNNNNNGNKIVELNSN